MVKVVLIDLDGTVYEGNQLIEGAIDAITNLRKHSIKVIFCTNNSSIPPERIVKKLNSMGIECKEDELLSSIEMMVSYIDNHHLKKVYICGSEDIIDYCKNNGVDLSDETKCENLVISMDPHYNYEKNTRAVRAAFTANKILICNEDRVFLKEDGLYPGCGAMTSSILFCANRQADVVVGKPSTYMLEYLCEKYGYIKDDLLVIGDTVDSDIKMANDFGCKSILIDEKGIEKNSIKSLKETINWDWSTYGS